MVENAVGFPDLEILKLSINKFGDEGLKILVDNSGKFPRLR